MLNSAHAANTASDENNPAPTLVPARITASGRWSACQARSARSGSVVSPPRERFPPPMM